MTDTRPPSDHLIARLRNALDRLELTLGASAEKLRDANEAAGLIDAMSADRAALAEKLAVAEARAAELEEAVKAADAALDSGVADAARELRDALAEMGVGGPPGDDDDAESSGP